MLQRLINQTMVDEHRVEGSSVNHGEDLSARDNIIGVGLNFSKNILDSEKLQSIIINSIATHKLVSIDLSDCVITGTEIFSALIKCKTLRRLNLENTKLTVEQIQKIKKLKQVTHLNLCNTMNFVDEAFLKKQNTYFLTFKSSPVFKIRDELEKTFPAVLKVAQQNALAAVTMISELLAESTCLQSLNFSKNFFQTGFYNAPIECAEVIGQGLKKNVSLEILDLSENSFDDVWLRPITLALYQNANTKLRELNLSKNDLNFAAVDELSAFLGMDHCLLEKLFLDFNKGIFAVGEIAYALKKNSLTRLHCLSLKNQWREGYSGLCDYNVKWITLLLQENQILTEVNLDREYARLKPLLERNKKLLEKIALLNAEVLAETNEEIIKSETDKKETTDLNDKEEVSLFSLKR